MRVASRRGDWMQTFTGRQFWPLDPRAEEVDIIDIAHALSQLCRFGGHTRVFYCVSPDTRVLTSDLRWTPAELLSLGDTLLAPEEASSLGESGRRRRRRLTHAVVTHAGIIYRPVWRLVLADGSHLRASSDHPWLVAVKQAGNQRWITTERLAVAVSSGQRRYALRILPVWEHERTYESGRLSALFDGEGHISRHNTSGTRSGGFSLGVSQNKGRILAEIEDGLRSRDVAFASRQNPQSSVWNVSVRGGWQDRLAIMGRLRPLRLIEKWEEWIRSGLLQMECHVGERVEIVEAVFQGQQAVVALETTAHTYFAEGFGAHNSVAEHCVRVSLACHPTDALAGLLHDAAEAYVVDVPRPLKRHLKGYAAAERAVQDAIANRFKSSIGMPGSVRVADAQLLATEARDLMSRPPNAWAPMPPPLQEQIEPWSSLQAKLSFLGRFRELMITR